MIIVLSYGIAFFCVFMTQCRPISNSWHPVPGEYRKSETIEKIVSVNLYMIIDTLIVALPMPPLWRLRMPIRRKVSISLLFSLGLLQV